MARIKSPLPLFDSLKEINETVIKFSLYENINRADVTQALMFLKSYQGSAGTFNTYRREVERLLQWCLNIAGKSLKKLKRDDIEIFLRFCQKPPKSWIGITKAPRFIVQDGIRVPNPKWRPFVATVKKAAHRKGDKPDANEFVLSQGSIKESFAILSSFFNYLLQEEYVTSNPVAMIRQKSQFIRRNQQKSKIRRLSELQWQAVIETAQVMAEENSEQERSVFMLSILYSMYLRISELAASERWVPTMNNFQQDGSGNWWFTTVGKGNKQRQIAVSDSMLIAFQRWRKHLNVSELPSPADNSPLLPKTKGIGPITSTNYIRCIIQSCFDKAIENLKKNGHKQQAESLMEATVHWLRHTGISDDVKRRPREHVRDDAGHSSGSTTDKYIDIELQERHKSAKNKQITQKNKASD